MKRGNGFNMSGNKNPKLPRRLFGAPQGFTLVEVLIALAIAAVIAIFLYETFISTSRVTEKIEQEREVYREIRLTADQLTRELLSAYQPPALSGASYFSGVHETGSEGSMDSLSFYAMSHLHLVPDQPDAELTRVRYFLEKPSESKWYQLSHEEYPHFLSKGPPEKEVLIEKVKELNIKYFDGKTWLPEWDSKKSNLSIPAAVKVSLVVIKQDGTPEEWVRQVNLVGF
ncbi:MAG: type II secretion system protein GspJ [Nitrospirae bacterium]|nr:type II secretion system protein GspJ [Nitrospirota bacterium]MBI3351389.1 type II secretion system protein GspJ [Nitrospirota bacterium]